MSHEIQYCPFCHKHLLTTVVMGKSARLHCPDCGPFELDANFMPALMDDLVVHSSVMRWLRDHQHQGHRLYLVNGPYEDPGPGAPLLTLNPDEARALP
jgi:hypothetical protein